MPLRGAALPFPLVAGFVLFVGVIAWLVGASFVRRDVAAFAPDPPRPGAVPVTAYVEDTITVDARDATAWQFVDLARGTVLPPPDTQGWDVAVRRFHLVSSGGAATVGVRFEDVREAPDTGYVPTAFSRDTVNAALAGWYRYSFLSHLLHPVDRVWVLRTADGHYAKLRVLGYYCPGLLAGCMTLRYAYQPDGSRRLE